jgi:hypothetical protein
MVKLLGVRKEATHCHQRILPVRKEVPSLKS